MSMFGVSILWWNLPNNAKHCKNCKCTFHSAIFFCVCVVYTQAAATDATATDDATSHRLYGEAVANVQNNAITLN